MVREYIAPDRRKIANVEDVKARMRITYNKDNVADVRIGSIQIARLQLDDKDMVEPDKAIREYLKPSAYSIALKKFSSANAKRKATLRKTRRIKRK